VSPRRRRSKTSQLSGKSTRPWLPRALAGITAALFIAAAAPGVAIATRCALAPKSLVQPAAGAAQAHEVVPGYSRAGSATYLTLPEWLIVYTTEEYASTLRHARPSAFPYFGSIADFWWYYAQVCGVSCGSYSFDAANHVMLVVIGSSFAVEQALKGVYENSVGRLTEAVAGSDTEEDAFAAATAEEYGRFMPTTPWYEFAFGEKFRLLWRETPLWGAHPIRKFERRFALSAEYAAKAIYGFVIRLATKTAYGDEDPRTFVRVDRVPPNVSDLVARRVRAMRDGSQVLALPRYEAFTSTAAALAARGTRFLDIAGNDRVLVTAISNGALDWTDESARVLFSRPLATDRARRRIALDVRVTQLGEALAAVHRHGAALEHIYDF
jgi:hypothetical protein